MSEQPEGAGAGATVMVDTGVTAGVSAGATTGVAVGVAAGVLMLYKDGEDTGEEMAGVVAGLLTVGVGVTGGGGE